MLVETMASAISAGTEMLLFRGEAPSEMARDDTIVALMGSLAFPLKYGYAAVGRVAAVGDASLSGWEGRRVFSLHPHESRFLAAAQELIALPAETATEDALFLASMETAVNLVQDVRAVLGERAVVFGQGVVGLLATGLLAAQGLAALVTVDGYARRREASRDIGAQASFDPHTPNLASALRRALGGEADVALEVSGSPSALNQALEAMAFGGRIIVGSWFGTKPVSLDLGRGFHRRRLSLTSSQVSSLGAGLGPAWTKERRMQVAMHWLSRLQPSRFITHRFALDQAQQAYAFLDHQPDSALQVALTYGA
jgi:2-desacetyl-2-hydroxyethyl bacteriochlorophyllide A dehydrogenase